MLSYPNALTYNVLTSRASRKCYSHCRPLATASSLLGFSSHSLCCRLETLSGLSLRAPARRFVFANTFFSGCSFVGSLALTTLMQARGMYSKRPQWFGHLTILWFLAFFFDRSACASGHATQHLLHYDHCYPRGFFAPCAAD
jgi:hypothetical protein